MHVAKQLKISQSQGHPTGNFEKRPKNNNRAWIKLFEPILSTLGERLLGKINLFFTLSKTDREFPAAQQGASTTYNLTYWEVSQRAYVQTLLASLGVVIRKNSALQWGWGEGGR